jgi:hypothetical protein
LIEEYSSPSPHPCLLPLSFPSPLPLRSPNSIQSHPPLLTVASSFQPLVIPVRRRCFSLATFAVARSVVRFVIISSLTTSLISFVVVAAIGSPPPSSPTSSPLPPLSADKLVTDIAGAFLNRRHMIMSRARIYPTRRPRRFHPNIAMYLERSLGKIRRPGEEVRTQDIFRRGKCVRDRAACRIQCKLRRDVFPKTR